MLLQQFVVEAANSNQPVNQDEDQTERDVDVEIG